MAIDRAAQAARASQFPEHAINAVAAAFAQIPGMPGAVTLDLPNGESILLGQVSNQISYQKTGAKTVHLPMGMEEAKRWAAIDVLFAFAELKRRSDSAQAFLRKATDANLKPLSA